MCGITGWINYNERKEKIENQIKAMNETLTPRGPDEEGYYYDEECVLGHRRLIVIDPEGGKQPMKKNVMNSEYIIVYNGELYNTEEVRSRLLYKGYDFESYSDTEVVLTAYIEWGKRCVQYFNGIYAFAVWNKQTKTLFAARDRIGVKPFFYVQKNNSLIFASEIKAILENKEIVPYIDLNGLSEILFLGPSRIPGNGVIAGIKELKPGYCLLYNAKEGIKVENYWQLESLKHNDNFDTTCENVNYLVTDAIEKQLVSDVPVCCFLSGGLDSSIITDVASKRYKQEGRDRIHTFSVDYKGNNEHFKKSIFQPESDDYWIREVSNHAGSVHHNVILDNEELFDELITAVKARDLPGMADIDSSLYMFCREVKKKATVALSGECAT